METVGAVETLTVESFSYVVQAREGTGAYKAYTGIRKSDKRLPAELFQDHINTYFRDMPYNYRLIERINRFTVDKEGNIIGTEPVYVSWVEMTVQDRRIASLILLGRTDRRRELDDA